MQNVFRHLEPFRPRLRVWRTDGRTGGQSSVSNSSLTTGAIIIISESNFLQVVNYLERYTYVMISTALICRQAYGRLCLHVNGLWCGVQRKINRSANVSLDLTLQSRVQTQNVHGRTIFTALHWMQRGLSTIKPSVTRVNCDKTKALSEKSSIYD